MGVTFDDEKRVPTFTHYYELTSSSTILPSNSWLNRQTSAHYLKPCRLNLIILVGGY